MLHQHLSGFGDGRSLNNVHASELTKPDGMCPRAYAIYHKAKPKPKDEYLTASERVTFQIGRDLERDIINWFADMGKAVGDWKCKSCGEFYAFTTRPHHCVKCGGKNFEHKETRIDSAQSSVSCGLDLLLGIGEPRLRLVELKTIDKDKFKELQAPLAEHKWRTELYLRSVAESDDHRAAHINTEVATILYVSKGGYGCADAQLKLWGLSDKFSPFKEYEIKRNDAAVDGIVKRAEIVKRYREGIIGMPEGICSTAVCSRAARCPVRKECWSGDFSPEYKWFK